MKTLARMLLLAALFALLALPGLAQDDAPLVGIGGDEETGPYLVGPDGMTLYLFTLDDANCTGGCLENWPPLTVESEEELTKAEDIPGDLGIFEREDGTMQVTYNGMPLYYWINDEEAGDTTGDGVNNVWYIVEPVDLYAMVDDEFGTILVGPTGMTLYLFTPDDANCVDGCLENWPPFTTEDIEDVTISRDLTGELGVFEREDGTQQITYNGVPLYFWINDEAIGDTTGQGVNDVWYVIQTINTRTDEELGEFLVGPMGMTLYLFTPDDADCTGGCLENWPPLTAFAEGALQLGAGLEGELGVFEREDGTQQVTYNGIPLYYWINDEAPGDTTGEGVNDVWFIVEPGAGDMMMEEE